MNLSKVLFKSRLPVSSSCLWSSTCFLKVSLATYVHSYYYYYYLVSYLHSYILCLRLFIFSNIRMNTKFGFKHVRNKRKKKVLIIFMNTGKHGKHCTLQSCSWSLNVHQAPMAAGSLSRYSQDSKLRSCPAWDLKKTLSWLDPARASVVGQRMFPQPTRKWHRKIQVASISRVISY